MSNQIRKLKYGVYGAMALLGILFDDVNGSRLYWLVGFFVGFFLVNLLRDGRWQGKPWRDRLYLLDGGLILLVELNSRYVVNYFFHVFYIFILIELAFEVGNRAIPLSAVMTGLSMVKFYTLLSQRMSFGSLSETLFFLFVNILIIVSGVLSSRYRREKEEKEALYRNLLEATGELEKMTREKERTRIARDIHDTLGHEMSGLIMQLELASRYLDKDPETTRQMLAEAREGARSGLKRVREVVEALRESHHDLEQDLDLMISNYRSRTAIDVETDWQVDFGRFYERDCLYRLVQEALTNVARHSDADRVHVSLLQKEHRLFFTIADNGTNKPVMKKGYGLRGMQERIGMCGGTLEIGYDNGFVLTGNLPMGGEHSANITGR